MRINSQETLVYPNDFIELAEQQNLISELGEAIFHKICNDIVEHNDWNNKFSINLSPKQFELESFVDNLERIVDLYSLNLNMFKFEVTETAMIQNLRQLETSIKQLRQKGVEILLDDFGTGYASLSILKNLPVDTIKIDRSFCSDLETDDDAKAIIQALVSMARALKKKIVCEGIETDYQLNWLKTQGIDFFQGYLISKPLKLKTFKI